MLFSIRIFTATLGRKNSLVGQRVFYNVSAKQDNKGRLENYLHD